MTEWCVWSQNPLIQKTARGDWSGTERLVYGVMSDATQSAHEPPATFRIGILDNDACALDCIARLATSTHIHGRIVDVWSTTSPAVAILECQSGSRHTDVLLIDMALDGVTGPQIAAEIHRRAPGIVLIGLTVGLAFGLTVGLAFGLAVGFVTGRPISLTISLVTGRAIGLAIRLASGGARLRRMGCVGDVIVAGASMR